MSIETSKHFSFIFELFIYDAAVPLVSQPTSLEIGTLSLIRASYTFGTLSCTNSIVIIMNAFVLTLLIHFRICVSEEWTIGI